MWLRLLGLAAAALIAAAVVTVVVDGIITKRELREKMREEGMKRAVIDMIDNSNNTIKLKDLDSDKVMEVKGDGISDEISQGDCIYV